MNIVRGRGKNRKVFEYPCAEIVKRSPEKEQRMGRDLLCNLLDIDVPAEGAAA